MDATTLARWRALCLLMLGAAVYAAGLLPGDVDLHREIIEQRGTMAHAVARWLDYGGEWQFLAPAMLLLLA